VAVERLGGNCSFRGIWSVLSALGGCNGFCRFWPRSQTLARASGRPLHALLVAQPPFGRQQQSHRVGFPI
jgi:hypothetical protein